MTSLKLGQWVKFLSRDIHNGVAVMEIDRDAVMYKVGRLFKNVTQLAEDALFHSF